MKNSNRPVSTSSRVQTYTVTSSLHVAYVQPIVKKAGVPVTELVAMKATEKSSKLGRRYSFDDNGGGYQGL